MSNFNDQKKRFNEFFSIKLPSSKNIYGLIESDNQKSEYMLFVRGSTIVFGIPNKKINFYDKHSKSVVKYDRYFIFQYHNTSNRLCSKRWYPNDSDGKILQKFIKYISTEYKAGNNYYTYKAEINKVFDILKDIDVDNRGFLIGGKDI